MSSSVCGCAAPRLPLSHIREPMLSRQTPPYPGAIGRCRSRGVPCPAPHFDHGTVCRLVDCSRAATANLPFAISPGVCSYHCLHGRVWACVLLGSATSAICGLTICDEPGRVVSADGARGVSGGPLR